MGGLANLEKLDLRWNPVAAIPDWLRDLEARGVSIFL